MELKLRYVAKDNRGNINTKVFTIEEIEMDKPYCWLALLLGKNVKIIARDLFTLKQDRKDEDIYENDIWERQGFVAVIIFKYSQWFFEKAPSSKCCGYPTFTGDISMGKVIGNKWQNPELL